MGRPVMPRQIVARGPARVEALRRLTERPKDDPGAAEQLAKIRKDLERELNDLAR